jgi:hypothetical protein
MNEYDLIFAWSEATSHLHNLMQFLVSITFAVLLVGYFASDRLNLFLVCVLATLYSAFSAYYYSLFMSDGRLIMSIYSDVAALMESQGAEASQALISLSSYIAWGGEIATYALVLILPSTYLCALGYLICGYKSSGRNHGASS